MAAHAQEQRVYRAGLMDLVYKIRALPQYVKGYSIVSEGAYQNGCCFRLQRTISAASWGEDISLTILPVDAYNCSVQIYSECSMPTQLVDMGRNKKNVAELFAYIG